MCDESHKNFKRLIEILQAELLVMLEVYFDESGTHDGSPLMCIAGYVFRAEQALHLDGEWRSVLASYGIDYYHTADCAHGVDQFSKLTRQQRGEIHIALINIIKRRMEIGIVVSASDNDFGHESTPEWIRGGPYVLCAMQVLGGITGWAEQRHYSGKISYFFESGHKHQSLTNQAIQALCSSAVGVEAMRYHSHTFANKRLIRPLQAADILAYEWNKEMIRLNCQPPATRSMRRSLESLLERRHVHQHFGAAQIDEFNHDPAALLRHMRKFDDID